LTALALAGLSLLLLPPADARPLGGLEAAGVDVSQGDLDAELLALRWLAPPPPSSVLGGTPPLSLPGFSIAAARAEVTVYHSERVGASEVPRDDPPTRATLTDAVASGAVGDAADARLTALPPSPGLATVSAGGAAFRIVPAPAAMDSPARVTGAPDVRVETPQALQVEPAGDGLLRITGSFRLVVDGLDFTLSSGPGSFEVHTRTDVDGPQVQAGRVTYAAHSTFHEAVLDLEGASVVLPVTEAIVPSAHLGIAGRVTFRDSTVLASDAATQPDREGTHDLELEGSLTAELERRGPRIAATLDGALTRLAIDGQSASVAPASRLGGVPGPALLAFAAVATAAAMHAGIGRWRFARLDRLMAAGDYEAGLIASERFRLHPRLAADALLAGALCLTALGRPGEARTRLLARDWRPARRSMRDFVLARAAALLGERDEATLRLAASLLADPRLIPQARADPALAGLIPRAPPVAEEAYS
jgi:hypothetical protein